MPGGPEYPVLGGTEHKTGANHGQQPFSGGTTGGPPWSTQGPVAAPAEVDLPFIGSVTQVYTPTLGLTAFNLPFIASVTTLYTPTLELMEIDLGFIGSVTTVYALTVAGATARLSQEAVEVAVAPIPHARLSQHAVEVARLWDPASVHAGVSQFVVEVLKQFLHEVDLDFISSVTTVYALGLEDVIHIPFIGSVTVVYAPQLPEVNLPFIASHTTVWGVWSMFDPNKVFGTSPGNGGEQFITRLAPSGSSVAATLSGSIGTGTGTITLSGDTGMPTDHPFQVTIDSEKIYLSPLGGHNYLIRTRGMGNTTPASHSAGASVVWDDSYDMAVEATEHISQSFTADITASGSQSYPGWLIAYDSSQAYNAAGDRYPTHVALFVGVFAAGAGTGGTNKCDASQPNAICTPTGISDDCPAALSNPARISSDIAAGDIAVVRYTNTESYVLDLGPRSVAIQSWYGMKRVDASDSDVTFTDPNGIVVDTTGGEGTYTGVINGEFDPPVSGPAISPATGLPTPNDEPYTSVVMPHTNRHFTRTVEKGWPIGALAVRHERRRVPFWQSWDWHNYGYVYDGFGVDCTYIQMVINRNGIVFGSVPEVDLPNNADIDGPQAVWDDGSYYFGVSWYVCLFANAYLVLGPIIGGTPPVLDAGGFVPVVSFPGGVPVVRVPSDEGPPPPFVEGGQGGDISPPQNTGMHVWQTS